MIDMYSILESVSKLVVEEVAIAILVSVIVTGSFSAYSIWQTKRVAGRQAKIDSARLLLEMDRILREERFRIVNDYIYDNDKPVPDDSVLVPYLNQLDTYAVYWEDGMITLHHISEMYGPLLVKVKNNRHICDLMRKKDEEFEKQLYLPLQRLWNKL